jgi:hypothetical protein
VRADARNRSYKAERMCTMRNPSGGTKISYGVRVVSVLLVSCQFVFALQTDAATSVPHQLYGKSVTIYRSGQLVFDDEKTGKLITSYSRFTDDFYFSVMGRIFVRSLYRNQFGSSSFE